MNPIQEAKQELEASIRYAENAIDKAKQTIEQMGTYQEQTGREAVLESELAGSRELLDAMTDENIELEERNDKLNAQVVEQTGRIAELEAEVNKLRKEKEASSGPCGCQAYRDLEERATMPVIPKAVAIAIFREGVQHGVEAACTELDEATYIRIEESEYVGDFHITFERDIDLNEHIDTDWMRDQCGDYSEERVIDALGNLCADKEFECRIHGVDDQEEKKND